MQMDLVREIRVGYMACGSGFGAHGFRKGDARVGNLRAKFRNIGGIDNDPAAIRDFERFAGVKGTLLDLMSLEQYRDFHGHEPPDAGQPKAIFGIGACEQGVAANAGLERKCHPAAGIVGAVDALGISEQGGLRRRLRGDGWFSQRDRRA